MAAWIAFGATLTRGQTAVAAAEADFSPELDTLSCWPDEVANPVRGETGRPGLATHRDVHVRKRGLTQWFQKKMGMEIQASLGWAKIHRG